MSRFGARQSPDISPETQRSLRLAYVWRPSWPRSRGAERAQRQRDPSCEPGPPPGDQQPTADVVDGTGEGTPEDQDAQEQGSRSRAA
jgi:hypothetical protein